MVKPSIRTRDQWMVERKTLHTSELRSTRRSEQRTFGLHFSLFPRHDRCMLHTWFKAQRLTEWPPNRISRNLSIFTDIHILSDKMIADQLIQSYINFMFHLLYLGSQSTAKVTLTKQKTLDLSLTFLSPFSDTLKGYHAVSQNDPPQILPLYKRKLGIWSRMHSTTERHSRLQSRLPLHTKESMPHPTTYMGAIWSIPTGSIDDNISISSFHQRQKRFSVCQSRIWFHSKMHF